MIDKIYLIVYIYKNTRKNGGNNMVVDGKGNIFENRRKIEDRRKEGSEDKGGKRKTQRRKETNSEGRRHGQ